MRAPERRDQLSVAERLGTQSDRFELFQAVRLIEQIAAGRQAPSGTSYGGDQEAVRFRTQVSLTGSALNGIELGQAGEPTVLTQSFFGLHAPVGPLPMHYTEALLRADDGGDQRLPLADLLDSFAHRLLSLRYRAWAKYRPYLFSAPPGNTDSVQRGTEDRETLSRHLRVLSGLGPQDPKLKQQPEVEERLLAFAGLLARRRPTAASLQAIISGFFGLPVRIEQFVAEEVRLSDGSAAVLGQRRSSLGNGAVLGRWARIADGKFRVHIGPLSEQELQQLRPPGTMFQTLSRLISLIAGPVLAFDLCLRGLRIASPRLGSGLGPALGRDAWLGSAPEVQEEIYGPSGQPLASAAGARGSAALPMRAERSV